VSERGGLREEQEREERRVEDERKIRERGGGGRVS
jgi:hypothetical protein